MKGVINKYFEEKGFGFIKDENEEKRFFHVSDFNQKRDFLDNLSDYFYSEAYNEECLIITFVPGKNNKGLIATNINLTKQILNDKSQKGTFKGKITDLKYDTSSLTRITSGIKKGEPKPFNSTAGGNGTFRIGYPEEKRELNLYFNRIDDLGWGKINVRDLVLNINGRKKITANLVKNIHNQLIGEIIDVCTNGQIWILNDQLILKL